MVTDTLQDFVAEKLAEGRTPEELQELLVQYGWDEVEVAEALAQGAPPSFDLPDVGRRVTIPVLVAWVVALAILVYGFSEDQHHISQLEVMMVVLWTVVIATLHAVFYWGRTGTGIPFVPVFIALYVGLTLATAATFLGFLVTAYLVLPAVGPVRMLYLPMVFAPLSFLFFFAYLSLATRLLERACVELDHDAFFRFEWSPFTLLNAFSSAEGEVGTSVLRSTVALAVLLLLAADVASAQYALDYYDKVLSSIEGMQSELRDTIVQELTLDRFQMIIEDRGYSDVRFGTLGYEDAFSLSLTLDHERVETVLHGCDVHLACKELAYTEPEVLEGAVDIRDFGDYALAENGTRQVFFLLPAQKPDEAVARSAFEFEDPALQQFPVVAELDGRRQALHRAIIARKVTHLATLAEKVIAVHTGTAYNDRSANIIWALEVTQNVSDIRQSIRVVTPEHRWLAANTANGTAFPDGTTTLTDHAAKLRENIDTLHLRLSSSEEGGEIFEVDFDYTDETSLFGQAVVAVMKHTDLREAEVRLNNGIDKLREYGLLDELDRVYAARGTPGNDVDGLLRLKVLETRLANRLVLRCGWKHVCRQEVINITGNPHLCSHLDGTDWSECLISHAGYDRQVCNRIRDEARRGVCLSAA